MHTLPLEETNILSLHQLNMLIQEVINTSFYHRYFWVKAEIHKLNLYKYSGHAYPELVEKRDGHIICQMRGIIWKGDLMRIQNKFIETINEPLKENIMALMYVTVKFDPRYGLAIQIKDIDPNYTLGELEKQKKYTIERLKKEGLFELNKKQELALVPQRIAIISVETSKGYNDLITIFEKYKHLYYIQHHLYPSLLQGEEAAHQIRIQLNNIRLKKHLYDAVLIIRGGGGEVGLSCYNDYELCKEIATFPLPVITGIGHSTNEVVAEKVAYKNGITPTETALWIIKLFETFEKRLHEVEQSVQLLTEKIFIEEKNRLSHAIKNLSLQSKEIFHQQKDSLQEYKQELQNSIQGNIRTAEQRILQIAHHLKENIYHNIMQHQKYLETQGNLLKYRIERYLNTQYQPLLTYKQWLQQQSNQFIQIETIRLQNTEKHIQLLHPENILKRGYSIVLNKHQRVLKDPSMLKEQDLIHIQTYQAQIEANIFNIKIKNYEPKPEQRSCTSKLQTSHRGIGTNRS